MTEFMINDSSLSIFGVFFSQGPRKSYNLPLEKKNFLILVMHSLDISVAKVVITGTLLLFQYVAGPQTKKKKLYPSRHKKLHPKKSIWKCKVSLNPRYDSFMIIDDHPWHKSSKTKKWYFIGKNPGEWFYDTSPFQPKKKKSGCTFPKNR